MKEQLQKDFENIISNLNLSQKDIGYAKEFGYVIKLLAVTELKSSKIYSKVSPYLVSNTHPLSKVEENYNAVEINGDLVGKLWFQGEGAGKLSTTSAVIGDLLGIYWGFIWDLLVIYWGFIFD